MDKLKMAHEYLRDIIKASGGNIDVVEMPEAAWKLADAMQAESDERKQYDPMEKVREKEQQLDWSQAPHPNAVGFKIIDGKVEFLIGHRGVDGKLSVGYSEFNDDWSPIEHYHALHNDYLRKRPSNI